jgi:ribosomal 50S subunit-associated protein YjgA (DUF615 family)
MQDERPSKTQRKKEVEALQALGERLVELNADQLAKVPLPDDLRDAVLEAKRIRSREGRRRQLQYIGKLMREIDPAPIARELERWDGQSREATAVHHRIERWRLRLLDDDAHSPSSRAASGADLQRLRRACEARKGGSGRGRGLPRSLQADQAGRRTGPTAAIIPAMGAPDRPLKVCLVSVSDRASGGVYKDEGSRAKVARPGARERVDVRRAADSGRAAADRATSPARRCRGCISCSTGGTGPRGDAQATLRRRPVMPGSASRCGR